MNRHSGSFLWLALALGVQCFAELAMATSWWQGYDLDTLAVVRVPVADMLSKPAEFYTRGTVKDFYNKLPLSCESDRAACARVHQCLMNELLFETEYHSGECLGHLPDAYYGFDDRTQQPYTSYYTLTSNTVSLKVLKENGVNLSAIPSPLCLTESSSSILTLTMPWYETVSKITYSAGTRFVRLPELDTEDTYGVELVDYDRLETIKRAIPKELCIIDAIRSPSQKRDLFLTILKRWVSDAKGVIPYVLGGSSFIHAYDKTAPFWLDEANPPRKVWMRVDTTYPHTGFDCSELVWRAARMAGIPYFYKNTAMLARFLEPAQTGDTILDGDLIWVPGHVMIISDIAHNELIESYGYLRGYGKVHSISLEKKFKNIATYADLMRAYLHKSGLTFLSKSGEEIAFAEFKIFKLLGRSRQRERE